MEGSGSYEQAMKQAAALAEADDYFAATEAYQEAIAVAPQRAEAHYELGLLHYRVGEAKEAAACLERAASLQPRDARMWNNLAVARYACGEWERSEQAFREALAHKRTYGEAWYGLARVLLEQNRGREAARALITCLRWEPQHRRARAALEALRIEEIVPPVPCSLDDGELPPGSCQGKVVLISGIGHCGTAWLARVLHRPSDGMVFYHELKKDVVGLSLKETMQIEFDRSSDELDRLYAAYWATLENQLRRYHVVGDSHSWTPYLIPEVASRMDLSCVIYLVRNGIQNVHSHHRTKRDFPRDHFLYADLLRRYWELLGHPTEEWETYTKWECNCFWWELNHTMPKWLAERLGEDKVLVYRLEDLSQDADLLIDLIRELHPDSRVTRQELMQAQRMDVNRHIQGDRTPEALWVKWTEPQREAFIRICGDTMAHYGYPIPQECGGMVASPGKGQKRGDKGERW